jgi:hypothetical protein
MRERLLLLTAVDMYEKSAKSALAHLENLNLSTSEVQTVQSRCGIAKDAIEKAPTQGKAAKIEFTQPVAVTLRDCLALYYQQTSKLIEKAEGLRSGTAEPQELQQELKALHLKLGDTGTKPLDYVEGSEQTSLLPDAGGVDGNGTLPPKADKVRPLTGIPD